MPASSSNSRWISSLNGSSFEPGDARRYDGASAERNAARTVLRDKPVRRASSLIETPRTKCSRRSSAHRSTPTNPFLLASIHRPSRGSTAHRTPPPPPEGGHFSTGEGGSVSPGADTREARDFQGRVGP